ncbi:hypothetical protein [Parasphingorhabdus cellanae]|uniref:Uncharacterized protein n=1 Tax=Parasphingorhabdus cellanae TaxID=2806553 RepID=A0ABX7T9Z1_9SPHN|nr:hypothetical protein [Parasphingorhabdus cellanae]QTD57948.1 hypothetical protein J4G78_07110 [Parasphingorhabdus cellanae]
MTTEKATYRYFKILIPAMLIYLAGSIGTTWAADNVSLPPPALYALACVPVVSIFFVFFAHWRFAVEVDEFMRLIQIKATLFGVACVMTVSSGWGTFEMLIDAPKLQVFWLLPIFWISHSVAVALISKREQMY